MHDFESKGSALRAAGAIVLTLAAGAAWAQAAAPADAAARQPTSAASTSTAVHRARQHRAGGARYREGGLSVPGAGPHAVRHRGRARGPADHLPGARLSGRCTWTCPSSRWPTASSSCRYRKPRWAACVVGAKLFAADHPRRSARAAGRRGAELQQGPRGPARAAGGRRHRLPAGIGNQGGPRAWSAPPSATKRPRCRKARCRTSTGPRRADQS